MTDMRTDTILGMLFLAAIVVSCRPVVFEVHPCDDLAAKVAEAVEYALDNPDSDVRVLLTGGVYRLQEPIRLDGIKGLFTIGNVRGAHPLIAGDLDVRGWQDSDLRDGVVESDIVPGIDLGKAVSDTNRVDFYACDERQLLARWPNDGEFTKAGKCLDGEVEYTDSRIEGWSEEKDPFLNGYWCWDWYESYKKFSRLDLNSHIISVEPATESYGYKDGCRFYGLNLLCELDEDGEYYIDRERRKIYWMAPEGFFDKKHPTTRISLFGAEVVVDARNCSGLKIKGLEFRGFRGGVISFKNCSRSSVRDCYIHCIGETAVTIDGGVSNSVRDCEFLQLGKMGIKASGGNRKTLEPAGFEVRNCEFSQFALYRHTYNPAIIFYGVGATISGCEFSESTSSAIRTEGNDILIERCKFSDLVEESDDQGAIESFGNYAYRRCIIRFNRFEGICHGTNCGSSAVRFDDFISGNEVYGNVFKECGSHRFGAVQINGGRDNSVHHNIFVDCNYSISCTPWSMEAYETNWNVFQSRWADIDLTGEPYASRYPELLEPADKFNINRNYFYRNLTLRTKEESFRGEYLEQRWNVIIK